jgi:hypothetical protein
MSALSCFVAWPGFRAVASIRARGQIDIMHHAGIVHFHRAKSGNRFATLVTLITVGRDAPS